MMLLDNKKVMDDWGIDIIDPLPKEVFIVEIGVIEKRFTGTKEQRHKLAVLKQMYRRAKRDGYALSVSNYATQDEKEFFSEIFTANLLDKQNVPSYIISGIEEILK